MTDSNQQSTISKQQLDAVIDLFSNNNEIDLTKSDLRGINLHGEYLEGFDFSNKNLSGADLSGAKLTNANFSNSVMIGVNFEKAYLASSGTEATETALKLIRLYSNKVSKKNKPGIISFNGNYHGRTLGSFMMSGFEAHDVHINDILKGNIKMQSYEGLIACGGFSYGDVLGAGKGWASKILFNDKVKDDLQIFFNDKNKFGLGICNGCQMLSQLRSIIPGTNNWPLFNQNKSKQFEARLSRVKINKSKSLFMTGMEGSILPIIVSHGEGRAVFSDKRNKSNAIISYVDAKNKKTTKYPFNPNGSDNGSNGFTNNDGRITIMMPHPERLFTLNQYSYHPDDWKISPWSKIFINARNWLK